MIMSVSFVVIAIFGMFNMIYGSGISSDLLMIELFYNLLMIVHMSGIFFRYAAISIFAIIVPWTILTALYISEIFIIVGNVIYIIVFLAINTLALYYREQH